MSVPGQIRYHLWRDRFSPEIWNHRFWHRYRSTVKASVKWRARLTGDKSPFDGAEILSGSGPELNLFGI